MVQVSEREKDRIEAHNRSMRGFPRAPEQRDPAVLPLTVRSLVAETADTLSPVLGIPKADLETALANAVRLVPHKATMEDRQDVLQELAATLYSVRPPNGAYATGVCRHVVHNWADRWHIRQHTSWEGLSGDDHPNGDWYRDQLLGMVEFEAKACGDLDGQALWSRLPDDMRRILIKRLRGVRLSGAERTSLCRHRKALTGILAPARM